MLFRLFDVNENNYLNKDDLTSLVTNYMLNKQIDPNPNIVEEYINDLMSKADLDLDNKLSFEEFVSYLKKKKELLSIFNGYDCLLDTKKNLPDRKGNQDESSGEDSDIENEMYKGKEERNEFKQKIKEGAEFYTKSDNQFQEEIMAGTEFSAVKPWKAVVLNSVPSNYEPDPHEGQVFNKYNK